MAHYLWILLALVAIAQTLDAAELSPKWRQVQQVQQERVVPVSVITDVDQSFDRSIIEIDAAQNQFQNFLNSISEKKIEPFFEASRVVIDDLEGEYLVLEDNALASHADMNKLMKNMDDLEKNLASREGGSSRMVPLSFPALSSSYKPHIFNFAERLAERTKPIAAGFSPVIAHPSSESISFATDRQDPSIEDRMKGLTDKSGTFIKKVNELSSSIQSEFEKYRSLSATFFQLKDKLVETISKISSDDYHKKFQNVKDDFAFVTEKLAAKIKDYESRLVALEEAQQAGL